MFFCMCDVHVCREIWGMKFRCSEIDSEAILEQKQKCSSYVVCSCMCRVGEHQHRLAHQC